MGRWSQSHKVAAPAAGACPRQGNQKAPRRHGDQILPGYWVQCLSSGHQGEVEFLPSSGEEVLVQFGHADDLSSLAWISRSDLRVTDSSHSRSLERADVRGYRETLLAIKLRAAGHGPQEIAQRLFRSEAWVRDKMMLEPSKIPKPKGMEWWDADGFCDVTYFRGYAKEAGLYEEIVSTVDWEQDKVWRVRKQEGGDKWHLRTVKECPGRSAAGFCGRSLQKVPDDTHQIGPRDVRHAARTKVHADWSCSLSKNYCTKRTRDAAVEEPYWWCSKCNWYVCDQCVQEMPDKATSKQVAQWQPGSSPKLDALVLDLVRDFHLPDPFQAGYTVKMNWYPDGFSRVSPHRHDNWTLLVSLGSPRVLTVDRARVLMEDGDLILFGTQSHGVPEMPKLSGGGRMSLVLMFSPDDVVGHAAQQRAQQDAPRRGAAVTALSAPRCALTPEMLQQMALARFMDWEEADPMELADETRFNDGSTLAALCAMGFQRDEVKTALMQSGGDPDQAVSLLLAASSIDSID